MNPSSPSATQGKPLVLSASRRTDLPGWHADALVERIHGKLARLRTRQLHGVVFWSRHLRPFIEHRALLHLVEKELDNPVLNLTITGLGGSDLEPRAPRTAEALELLPDLLEVFHNEPFRLRWRFDPILYKRSTLEQFEAIATVMAGLGIETCTFSFPSYRSLKGDLAPQFNAAGIEPWPREEKPAFLKGMWSIAQGLGLRLLSCCQPENEALCNGIAPASCIPAEVLERGHPHKLTLPRDRDWSQRKNCQCAVSEDLGDYERDRCLSGCAYCYSRAGG
jgi:hypothetical protein